jgi:hypothetical protein
VLASETHAAAIRNNGGLFVWLAALGPRPGPGERQVRGDENKARADKGSARSAVPVQGFTQR